MQANNHLVEYLPAADEQFAPKQDLSDKRNYCRNVFIDRDGGLHEAIRLNILDDRHREEILGFHFCRQYAHSHYHGGTEQPQFYIVGRDCPWDFEYVLHDGSNFFLEITRLADRALLKAIKAENDARILLQNNQLCGFEIRKIERLFPNMLPPDLVEQASRVENKRVKFAIEPDTDTVRIFLRPPIASMENLPIAIRTAIEKKANKSHQGKDRTILLLDNLTTHHNPVEFFSAVEKLGSFIDDLPFLSIWLYTGYYSDENGENCEYSLIPIKPSDREYDFLDQIRA